MSRRQRQDGSKEYIEGGWYKFRLWIDVLSQDERVHASIKICPVEGPGALNASERNARKRELIAEYTGKNKEVVKSQGALTFEEQGKVMFEAMRNRHREPVAESTLLLFQRYLRLYLNPILGKYPLSAIYNPELKLVVDSLVKKGLAASTIHPIITFAKGIVGSAVDPHTGEALYPSWGASLPSTSKTGIWMPRGLTSRPRIYMP